MLTPAIRCQQVCKSYGTRQVLDGIDLVVAEGEFVGIVGMNGSGKTTMIKSILDLVSIDGGDIAIFGTSHRKVGARARVAYLPDRFSPPLHLKGWDFINYMLELHASRPGKDEIHEMLHALDLEADVMTSSVARLSKGMTQKLGLASCLLSKKSLLVLDEPMSGLDPRARVLFKQQLFKLKQQGVTVFFSSHVLADVDELADKMAVLHGGRLSYQGTAADFKQKYNESMLEDAYIKCVSTAA